MGLLLSKLELGIGILLSIGIGILFSIVASKSEQCPEARKYSIWAAVILFVLAILSLIILIV